MRLAGIEKGGYYPTPQIVAERIATYFHPHAHGRGRLLDPCAGEGLAAASLGGALQCETWGAELSPGRAEKAAARLDLLHPVAWQQTTMSDEAVSILFLNPPYSHDGFDGEGRLETEFLRQTLKKLLKGGVLVFLIPQYSLRDKRLAGTLAGHFADLRAYRFLDGEYETFKQIVIFARRKPWGTPSGAAVEHLQALAGVNLPVLEPAPESLYPILPAPPDARFKHAGWSNADLVQAAWTHGLQAGKTWARLVHPPEEDVQTFCPAAPLKQGHIAMLIASGLMGTLRLRDETDRPFLAKGRVVKQIKKIEGEQAGSGEKGKTVTLYRDQFLTTLALLSPHGLTTIEAKATDDDVDYTQPVPANAVASLPEFVRRYGDQIVRQTIAQSHPLYVGQPTDYEREAVNRLGLKRPPLPLPGQPGKFHKPGLLPNQKHAAVTMARVLKEHGSGIVEGEMGSGKTSIALATVEIMDAYPALVVCPPHLVPKWCREIEQVIPGAKAVELERIGKTADMPAEINSVRTFLNNYRAGHYGPKAFAVVASTTAKLGSGWKPAVRPRVIQTANAEGQAQKQVAFACPTCGGIQVDKHGVPVAESYFLGKRRFCAASISGWELDADGRRKRGADGQPVWGARPCQAPLFQPDAEGTRRYALADYIHQHARGAFQLLIMDEAHEYKGKATDRAVATQRLTGATKYQLLLTGTIFNGRSTSLFWTLYRLIPEIRAQFGYHDETRWAARYGVLESTETRYEGEDGAYTGNRRYVSAAREKAGISPMILRYLLPRTVFLTLEDLGMDPRTYREYLTLIEPLPEQAAQETAIVKTLAHLARLNPNMRLLMTQWGLDRPNNAFRADRLVYHRKLTTSEAARVQAELQAIQEMAQEAQSAGEGLTARTLLSTARQIQQALALRREVEIPIELLEFGAVLDELPKETWLAEFCQTEKQQHRRVIVYCRQTGKRDIQEHLAARLRAAGLRVRIIPPGNPRAREAWINQHAPHLDVLVCNPRLVQTGLDLIAFSTVVFFEVEIQTNVARQALRRVWRLGQQRVVKAVFLGHQGSVEHRVLANKGRDMVVAQYLDGNHMTGGAFSLDDEENASLLKIAQDILDGKDIPELRGIFSQEAVFTDSRLTRLQVDEAVLAAELARQTGDVFAPDGTGNPVNGNAPALAEALPLPPDWQRAFDAWLVAQGIRVPEEGQRIPDQRMEPSPTPVSQGQLSLF